MTNFDIRSKIIARLIRAKGRVVTDEALLAAAYGYNPDNEPKRAKNCIEVTIHQIRKKLPPHSIVRERGVGYRMTLEAAAKFPRVDSRIIVMADVEQLQRLLTEEFTDNG